MAYVLYYIYLHDGGLFFFDRIVSCEEINYGVPDLFNCLIFLVVHFLRFRLWWFIIIIP